VVEEPVVVDPPALRSSVHGTDDGASDQAS
jgi:hypothetical protein